MKNAAIAILPAMSCVAGPAGHAAIYRWVDKNGNVVYQGQPPPAGATREQIRNLDVVPAAASDAAQPAAKQPVILYTVPHCDPCGLARTYLKQRNVLFSEVNVSTDPKAQQEMRKAVGELSVPAATVGSKVMQGYVPAQRSAALDHGGYPKIRGSSDRTSP